MNTPVSEYDDIQGLLRSGYGSLTDACFVLLRVTDAASARSWLTGMIGSVTTAGQLHAQHVDRALQLALTADGMRALGVAEQIVADFSAEFASGMVGEEGRSRRLGDVGTSSPTYWHWGGKETPHILLMLYATADVDAWWRQIQPGLAGVAAIRHLHTTDMAGREPFGFKDGISQPKIDWGAERQPDTTAGLEYGNLVSAGEFLLGYRNEYGLYTDRPLLEPSMVGAGVLPLAEDNPARHDLGRNGSYLVFRELAQDVRGFWRFIAAHADDEAGRVTLAQAMVGRSMEGEPLLPLQPEPIPGVDKDSAALNQFTFDTDTAGLRCPFGAHIRRANPRTADMPGGTQSWLSRLIRLLGFGHQDLSEDLVASSRFHRVLRRGREFGAKLEWRTAMQPDAPDPHSGLYFICLNANISRQFEFIQNAWLISAKFDGMSGEADPLLGTRLPMPAGHPTDSFRSPQPSGISRTIDGLPQFVTVRGGAYFFLPGIRGLRYIAGEG